MHLNQIRFMLCHERERKIKEHANFIHIVYLMAKLCNIFDEVFFIDVIIYSWKQFTLTQLCLSAKYFEFDRKSRLLDQSNRTMPSKLIFRENF